MRLCLVVGFFLLGILSMPCTMIAGLWSFVFGFMRILGITVLAIVIPLERRWIHLGKKLRVELTARVAQCQIWFGLTCLAFYFFWLTLRGAGEPKRSAT